MLPYEQTLSVPEASMDENNAVLTKAVIDACAGNNQAFEYLFEHYSNGVCTYLTRMVGSAEEGRDLAQETFLRAWRTLPTLQDEARFTSWLYRIATNIALDHLRWRRLRWPLWSLSEKDDQLIHAKNTETVERVADVEQVEQALRQVKPRYRACLLLQVLAGFPQREIAELLNLHEKSVSVYVKRGSEQFRQAWCALEQQ